MRAQVRKIVLILLLIPLVSACVMVPGEADAAGSSWKRLENYRMWYGRSIENSSLQIFQIMMMGAIQGYQGDNFVGNTNGVNRLLKVGKGLEYALKVKALYEQTQSEGSDAIGEAAIKEIIDFLPLPKGQFAGIPAALLEAELVGLIELSSSNFEANAYRSYMYRRIFKGESADKAFGELIGSSFSGMNELCRSYAREHKGELKNWIRENGLSILFVSYPAFSFHGDQDLLRTHIHEKVIEALEYDYTILVRETGNRMEETLNRCMSRYNLGGTEHILDRYLREQENASGYTVEQIAAYQRQMDQASTSVYGYDFPRIDDYEGQTAESRLSQLNVSKAIEPMKKRLEMLEIEHKLFTAEKDAPEWFNIQNLETNLEVCSSDAERMSSSILSLIHGYFHYPHYLIDHDYNKMSPREWGYHYLATTLCMCDYRSTFIESTPELQNKVYNLVARPIVTEAERIWRTFDLEDKRLAWLDELDVLSDSVETLRENSDIEFIADVTTELAYYLGDDYERGIFDAQESDVETDQFDPANAPRIKDYYTFGELPSEVNDYLYSMVFPEYYAQYIDLQKVLEQFVADTDVSDTVLMDLADKARAIKDELTSTLERMPEKMEVFTMTAAVNEFLGNKDYDGAAISLNGIYDYYDDYSNSHLLLSEVQLSQIEDMKEVLSSVRFKTERLERFIQAYDDIENQLYESSVVTKMAALDQSPFLEDLREWLITDYAETELARVPLLDLEDELTDAVQLLLDTVTGEGIIADIEPGQYLKGLSNVSIQDPDYGISEIADLIDAVEAAANALEDAAENSEIYPIALNDFRALYQYLDDYNFYPSPDDINAVVNETEKTELALTGTQNYQDFADMVEERLLIPVNLIAEAQRALQFIELLRNGLTATDEILDAGSLVFDVEADMGWWCIDLYEGTVTPAASTPDGDFNIQLIKDDAAYVAPNLMGGIDLLGPAPLSGAQELPDIDLIYRELSGELSGNVFAVLLSNGTIANVTINSLEITISNENIMAVSLSWEEGGALGDQ